MTGTPLPDMKRYQAILARDDGQELNPNAKRTRSLDAAPAVPKPVQAPAFKTK